MHVASLSQAGDPLRTVVLVACEPICITACYFFFPQSSFAPADNRGLSPNGAWAVDASLGFSYFGFLAFPRC